MRSALYIFCASSFLLTQNCFAEDANKKSGFYITGKVGASVLQQKKQKYLDNYKYYDADDMYIGSSTYYGKSGGAHTNARLGGGLAVGYNFDNYFNVPVRAEIDVMARMGDSSNYLRDRNVYPYYSPKSTFYNPKIIGNVHYEDKINNKVQLNTFMFNGFYDFKNKSRFTPYLMAGVGLASMDQTSIRHVTDTVYDINTNEALGGQWARLKNTHTTNNFAWNAGAGVRYKINEDFSLDFSYRYLDAGKSSFTTYAGQVYDGNVFAHERTKARVVTQDMMLGLTYNF